MVRNFMRSIWGQAVSPELKAANQMFNAGNYAAAGPAYHALGEYAEKEKIPHAAWFYLQAGRSHIGNSQLPPALRALEHGISLLISGGLDDKAYLLGQQFLTQLNNLGKEDEAEELAEFLRFGLPGYSVATAPQTMNTSQLLPLRCPTCEAPMRLIEVRWKNSHTAECAYCGNPVQSPQKVRG
jgi:hypothetical protein